MSRFTLSLVTGMFLLHEFDFVFQLGHYLPLPSPTTPVSIHYGQLLPSTESGAPNLVIQNSTVTISIF